ncbi:MAG: FtsX-like permease family protein [Euryarchaeota archaeon]|nr:FtsX-like permease family protein [Euryarchaeota archaeon]
MPRAIDLLKAALVVLLAVLPWVFLGTAIALIANIALIVVVIVLDARKNSLVSVMAVRYALRRPATTALVIGGLMVGTAIVSATFAVSDTMDNLITGQVTEGLGDVDMVIGVEFSSSYVFTNESELEEVASNLTSLDGVEKVHSAVTEDVVINNARTGLFSLSNVALGFPDAAVLTFGGFRSDGVPIDVAPSSGQAYVPEVLARDIDASEGDIVVLLRGNSTLPLTVTMIVDGDGLGAYSLSGSGFSSSYTVFVNKTDLQTWTGNLGRSNLLFVSLDHQVPTDRQSIETVLSSSGIEGLDIVQDRAEILEQGKEGLSAFISLFFVFGSFSVIAGMALVLNIFTMLAEERKSEMGITRAVGLLRNGLRRLFVYEGVVYATIAAAVGTGLGLLIAYVIILSVSGVFGFTGIDIASYFTFTPQGIAYSYLIGFAITMATVYFATMRVSRMNIVRAIRNIPDPPVAAKDRRTFLAGLLMPVLGALIVILGILMENLGACLSGLSLGTLSIGLLLRRFAGDRVAWNVAGMLTLAVWLSKVAGLNIFPYAAEIEMLVMAGLFLLLSALILVMFNSDALIRFFTAIIRARSSYRAVVRTAISYPLKAKFRTGLSIFIFGLVIFTVTILTMISGVMNYNIPIMVEETSGGFDTIAFTLDQQVVLEADPWGRLNATNGFLAGGNVSNLLPLSTVGVKVNDTVDLGNGNQKHFEFGMTALGVNHRFYTEGYYPLSDWDRSRFSSERQVWEGLMANGSLAIIDGGTAGALGGMMSYSEAERIVLNDSFTVVASDESRHNVTIVGVMKQSALTGLFVNEEALYEDLKAMGPNLMLVSYAEGLDPAEQSVLMEKDFLMYGLNTISVKALAKEITASVDSIFTLFRAFLAMGLIIGIVGLGIITIRSIFERRLEIGMMRAIGFTKGMVVINFALESAFISLLGIVAGSLLGILVGYQLWAESLEAMEFIFVIDWQPIVTVALLAFAATMLSILPAARGASKVSPAEVLRFE